MTKLESVAAQLNDTFGELYFPMIVGRAYRVRQVRLAFSNNGTDVSVLISHNRNQVGSGPAIAVEPPVWFFFRSVIIDWGSNHIEQFPEGLDLAGPQFIQVAGAQQIEIRVYFERIRVSFTEWLRLAHLTSFKTKAGL